MTFAQQRNRLTTHFSECIPVVKWCMTVQHQWQLAEQSKKLCRNDSKTEEPGEKNLYQCHSVHQKSHMDWSGVNPSLRSDTSKQLTA